ncbi:zinc finger protein 30 homolog [Ptychodera flava]|uniref:zinc finger protein 30 homolog n=1 Tax=Ptychodera flava TaxID=63121 RepID=UPI00396AA3F6
MDKFGCRVFVMISEDGLSSQYMGSQDFVTEFLTTGLKVKPCDVNVGHCHSSDIDRSDAMCVPGMRDGQMEKSFSLESKNLRNHPAIDTSRQDTIQDKEGREYTHEDDDNGTSTSQSENKKRKITEFFQPVQLSSKDSSAPLTHSAVSSTDFIKTENTDRPNTESSNQSVESKCMQESNINVPVVRAVDKKRGVDEPFNRRDDFREKNNQTKTGRGVCKMERIQTRGSLKREESRHGDSVPSILEDGSREKTNRLNISTPEEEEDHHGKSVEADEISETDVQDDTTDDCSDQDDYTSESSVESKRNGSQTSKQPKQKEGRRNRPKMTKQELETHKERIRKSMIDDKPHICEKCGKGYKNHQGLSVHLSVGICVKQKCKYCGLEFLYKDWQNHLVDVHAQQIRVSQCDHCDKLFTRRSNKSHHILKHHSEGRYECDICKIVFTYHRGLILHKRSHSEKTLQCRHCPTRFLTELKRQRHERDKHSELPAVCSECGETFNTRVKMMNHLKTMHGKPEFKCYVCGKNFYKNFYLRTHLEHHGELSREYTCKTCQKVFRVWSEYRSHCRSVCKKRDFLCEICGRGFKSGTNLRAHVQTHGEPSIKCELCPRVFKLDTSLKSHMRSAHSDEKPWQCDVCGYRCKLRENLMKHTRIHNR